MVTSTRQPMSYPYTDFGEPHGTLGRPVLRVALRVAVPGRRSSFTPLAETGQQRVATRQGHGFTDQDATIHMHSQFALSNIEERHVIRKHRHTPAEIAAAVLVVQRLGAIRHIV